MPLQLINIGAAANDGSGDPLRTAFGKVNGNSATVDTYMSALITTRSPDGVVKSYRPTSNSTSLRSALLVTAVQQAQTGDVITLNSGAFLINAPLTPSLAGGATGVTIVCARGATYRYNDNEHSIADYALFPEPQPVGTLAELQSALDGATASFKARSIRLVKDITVSANIVIHPLKTLIPDGHKLINSGLPANGLWFGGTSMPAGHRCSPGSESASWPARSGMTRCIRSGGGWSMTTMTSPSTAPFSRPA